MSWMAIIASSMAPLYFTDSVRSISMISKHAKYGEKTGSRSLGAENILIG